MRINSLSTYSYYNVKSYNSLTDREYRKHDKLCNVDYNEAENLTDICFIFGYGTYSLPLSNSIFTAKISTLSSKSHGHIDIPFPLSDYSERGTVECCATDDRKERVKKYLLKKEVKNEV